MSTYAHKGQILPLENQMVPISKDTSFHASYDYGLDGFNQGERISPIGVFGGLRFNGSGQHISVPEIEIKEGCSIEMWLNWEPGGSLQIPFGKTDSNNYFGLYSGGFRLQDHNNNDVTWASSPLVNKWFHLKLTRNSGQWELYVNSQSLGKRAVIGTLFVDTIGAGYVGDTYDFNGAISKVKVYEQGSLIRSWRLTEREGPISFDESGNGGEGIWTGSISQATGSIESSLASGKFKQGLLVEKGTENVVMNTDWSDWMIVYYNKDIRYDDIPPPEGINSKVVSVVDQDGNGNGYVFCYGDFAPQEASTTYTISVWVKTEAELILRAYTADNSEIGRMYTENQYVYPEDGWKKVVFSPVTMPADNQSDSLSFQFNKIEAEKRVWLCAPQMEAKSYSTSFTKGIRGDGGIAYPSEVLNLKEGTISCWFKPNDGFFKEANWNRIVGHSTQTNGNEIQLARNETADKVVFSISNDNKQPLGGSWSSVSSITSLQANKWYHLTGTWSASKGEVRLYVNGQLEDSETGASASAFPSKLGEFAIGYHPSIDRVMNGTIDELRVERRAVSAEEAAAWAASGLHYNYLDYTEYVD